MSEGTSFYVLKREEYLTAEYFADKLLGAVIEHPKLPSGRVKSSQIHKPECRTLPFLKDGIAIAATGAKLAVGASLQDLIDMTIAQSKATGLRIDAEKIQQRRISNLDEYWEALLTDSNFMAAVYPWIRSVQKSKSACLITGLMLCKNAHVEEIAKQTSNIAMSCRLPLVAILAATQAVPLPFEVPGDPGANFARGTTMVAASTGSLKEEMIIGLRYQRLRRPLFKNLPLLLPEGLQSNVGFSGKQQLSGDNDPDAEGNEEVVVKHVVPMVAAGSLDPMELQVERDELDWGELIAEEDREEEAIREAAEAASDIESEG